MKKELQEIKNKRKERLLELMKNTFSESQREILISYYDMGFEDGASEALYLQSKYDVEKLKSEIKAIQDAYC